MEKSKNQYLRYLGYGVGAIGMDLSYGLFNTFLMNYLTDVLLISAAYIGVIAFLARIWDGINDPMMGTIIDNTKSRWGKFRPWILTGAILNGVVLFFLFTNPGFSVVEGKINYGLYAYIAIMYVLWDMSHTIVDIPYWSMVPTLTKDPKKRNIVATIPRFFSGLGQVVVVVMTFPMVRAIGGEEKSPKGFSIWVAICGVVLILGCLVTVISTRGHGQVEDTETENRKRKFTLKEAYKIILSNDQLLVFIVVGLFFNTGWYLTNGLSTYYFGSVMQDNDMLSLFGIIAGGGQAAGLFLLPILSRKSSRNTVIKIGIITTIFGYFGMFLFGPIMNIFPLFAIFGFIGSIGVGSTFVAQTIMLADIVDYGAFRLGYRTDSILFSMKSLLIKLCYSIQSLIIGFGLYFSGYKGALTEQSTAAKSTISVLMFLVPPLLAIISLIIFSKRYKLSAEKMEEVNIGIAKIDNPT